MNVKSWIDNTFRPSKLFTSHFQLNHQFHGMDHHYISESYFIRPKSVLALQLFHEGIHFPSTDLHLLCEIKNNSEELMINFHVLDPTESKMVLDEIKSFILKQLIQFEKKINTDPTMNYVQSFCKSCIHENSKPFNICAKNCKYTPKTH